MAVELGYCGDNSKKAQDRETLRRYFVNTRSLTITSMKEVANKLELPEVKQQVLKHAEALRNAQRATQGSGSGWPDAGTLATWPVDKRKSRARSLIKGNNRFRLQKAHLVRLCQLLGLDATIQSANLATIKAALLDQVEDGNEAEAGLPIAVVEAALVTAAAYVSPEEQLAHQIRSRQQQQLDHRASPALVLPIEPPMAAPPLLVSTEPPVVLPLLVLPAEPPINGSASACGCCLASGRLCACTNSSCCRYQWTSTRSSACCWSIWQVRAPVGAQGQAPADDIRLAS